MKVAIVGTEGAPIPPIRGGAVQLGIWEVAPLLAEHVDEMYVISPSDPELPTDEMVRGVRHIRVGCVRRRQLIGAGREDKQSAYARSVAAVLDGLKPDIVHVRNRTEVVRTARDVLGSGVRIILHVHNPLKRYGTRRWGVLTIPPRCDAFVACSRFLLNAELPKFGLRPDMGQVIYNGVNTERFRSVSGDTEERRRLKECWGLGQEDPVVLFAGRIDRAKGVHHLARAMKAVLAKIPNAALIVAGEAPTSAMVPYEHETRNLLETLCGRSRMADFVPTERMPDLYAIADVFAGPSVWNEPFGLVFLEAQACGLPVVATRRGGIPEVVEDGVTGILVDDPSDIESLAAPIIRFLEDSGLREQFGRRGRERAEQFTWTRTAEKTMKLYHRLLDNASVGASH